jgi:hypothetical protein
VTTQDSDVMRRVRASSHRIFVKSFVSAVEIVSLKNIVKSHKQIFMSIS